MGGLQLFPFRSRGRARITTSRIIPAGSIAHFAGFYLLVPASLGGLHIVKVAMDRMVLIYWLLDVITGLLGAIGI